MKKNLSGWSKFRHFDCEVFTPNNFSDVQNFFRQNLRENKVIARGHGCSFGDQATLTDGVVVDTRNLDKILNYDKKKRKIVVEAGVRLSDILTLTLKDDLFFQSIPGGLDITVGGAISNNVHGKDCFKNGYFNENVSKINLILSEGELIESSKEKNKELFDNIFSSFGLLGFIYSVELDLIEIKSPLLETETIVVNNKFEMENFFQNSSKNSDYLIAWLDCSSKNEKTLRGICRKAKFIEKDSITNKEREIYKQKINHSLKKRVKNNFRKNVFNLLWFIIGNTFKSKFFYLFNFCAFNLFKILRLKKKNVLINEFTLLHEKYLPEYNNIFKSKGFVGIQPFFNNVKPFDKIEQVVQLCQKFNILPIWCPVKKYKNIEKKFFQFGGDGYSIVLEYSPHEIGLEKNKNFIDELEKLILKQGGKIYLAKDQIISKEAIKKMYPDYNEFLELKKKYDKKNLFSSEQFVRLLT